jgi:hypothetical protein
MAFDQKSFRETNPERPLKRQRSTCDLAALYSKRSEQELSLKGSLDDQQQLSLRTERSFVRRAESGSIQETAQRTFSHLMYLTLRVRRELRQAPSEWKTFTSLNTALLRAEKSFGNAFSPQDKALIVELSKEVERNRLTFSAQQFAHRYITEIKAGKPNEETPMPEGTSYVRSEVNAITWTYFKTPEHNQEVDRNDTHWFSSDPEDEAFAQASYRNTYLKGKLIAISNHRNKDRLKMLGPTMPNSEILINQMRAVVEHGGGDLTSLKLTALRRDAIQNQETLAVVRKYLTVGETKTFTPEHDGQAFEEFLHTPNGKSAKYLITDYRYLLGDKKISSLQVEYRSHKVHGNIADMTFTYEERSSEERSGRGKS